MFYLFKNGFRRLNILILFPSQSFLPQNNHHNPPLYLIKWQNLPHNKSTWESIDELKIKLRGGKNGSNNHGGSNQQSAHTVIDQLVTQFESVWDKQGSNASLGIYESKATTKKSNKISKQLKKQQEDEEQQEESDDRGKQSQKGTGRDKANVEEDEKEDSEYQLQSDKNCPKKKKQRPKSSISRQNGAISQNQIHTVERKSLRSRDKMQTNHPNTKTYHSGKNNHIDNNTKSNNNNNRKITLTNKNCTQAQIADNNYDANSIQTNSKTMKNSKDNKSSQIKDRNSKSDESKQQSYNHKNKSNSLNNSKNNTNNLKSVESNSNKHIGSNNKHLGSSNNKNLGNNNKHIESNDNKHIKSNNNKNDETPKTQSPIPTGHSLNQQGEFVFFVPKSFNSNSATTTNNTSTNSNSRYNTVPVTVSYDRQSGMYTIKDKNGINGKEVDKCMMVAMIKYMQAKVIGM